MSIKLVMLKSGEDIIADVKEIKSNEEVVGYYFDDPLIVRISESEEPTILNEGDSLTQYSSKIDVTAHQYSKSAISAIEAAGGTMVTIDRLAK